MNFVPILFVLFLITIMVSSSNHPRNKKIFFEIKKNAKSVQFCGLEKTLLKKFEPHFLRVCDEHRIRNANKTKIMGFIRRKRDGIVCSINEDEIGVDELMIRFCERDKF